MGVDQAYQDEGVPGVDALQVGKRYGEERAKRLRDDGNDQFIDISLSDKFQSFLEDPWVDRAAVKDARSMFPSNRCQMLILGAGWGGLLYAVRMIEAGIRPEDIRIIDTAGGFGGTWYWNRYPGISCDIESYCYLPLLEETGYVPRHRYSHGEEIRHYANLAAQKWGMADSAVFQTKAQKLVWDEEAKEWRVELVQQRKGEQPQTLNIRAPFVATVNGALNWPKLPGIPGILDYQGDIFHSSRWNYALTGGSPADPSLTKLQGKRVAIIGTGATAVQIVPHLAHWAKHLYVVQRTPSAVGHRDQRETDSKWFRKDMATSAGWQRERMRNFHQHFTTEKQPAVNMVDDEWTSAVSMVAISGNAAGPKTMDELPAYIQKLHAIDLPRQERIRRRVEQEVKDPLVAKKLQAWYPTWCKRPAFHDEYLSTFNRENVTLIDTDGRGPDQLTANSIVVGDQSYPVDVIICATGFRAPFTGSPAAKANATIIGRNGVLMSEEWARSGPLTQHGVLDHNFPNLFLSGPWQASLSPNNLFNVDTLAKLSAYILAEAKRKAGGSPFAVAPTSAAAENWGMQVMMNSIPMAAIARCTPGYFNVEGGIDRAPPEVQMIMARSGLWGHGIEDFVRIVEAWREEGRMQGIEVRT
ncbi:FAD/NAD(P)-binding domain-containing protein [Trematosphaeria pertusa]|uniref:FAD/NAD(P)-binding domain-containing protein n=1 Tax=Trematosphaeria pertusa TaxID=390896 RepID=A0A6A6IL11_9PLEO|nr:FAD/NAD(P)-binding domain-containing protein [Trematosphaeria pertusa]KAF2250183.1 FAD/NAD(P)-binding domain-containing protein [Trematosphaeria pertusa]